MAIIGTKNAIDSTASIWGPAGISNFPLSNLVDSFDKVYRATYDTEKFFYVEFNSDTPIRIVHLNDHNSSQTGTYSGYAYGPKIIDYDGSGFTSENFTVTTTHGTASLDSTGLALSSWRGTIAPKFNGFPYDENKTYAVFVKWDAAGAVQGLGDEPAEYLTTSGGITEALVHGSHGIKQVTSLSGTITKFTVRELVVSNLSQKLTGPLEVYGGREWGVFPWGGELSADETVWPKNTAWVFDKAHQLSAIRIVVHEDGARAENYFQLRNLHASYAIEIGNNSGQTAEDRLTYPDRSQAGVGGLGKIKQHPVGLPSVLNGPLQKRVVVIPMEQIQQEQFFSNLMHVAGQGDETEPIPFVYQPNTINLGLKQATTFYGFPRHKTRGRIGPGLRYSGASIEITEARL